MASRKADRLLIVEAAPVRNHLACVMLGEGKQIAHLLTQWVGDAQYLSGLENKGCAASRPYNFNHRHARGSLKGHFHSGPTCLPLYCRASLASPCRASLGLMSPAISLSRVRIFSRIFS